MCACMFIISVRVHLCVRVCFILLLFVCVCICVLCACVNVCSSLLLLIMWCVFLCAFTCVHFVYYWDVGTHFIFSRVPWCLKKRLVRCSCSARVNPLWGKPQKLGSGGDNIFSLMVRSGFNSGVYVCARVTCAYVFHMRVRAICMCGMYVVYPRAACVCSCMCVRCVCAAYARICVACVCDSCVRGICMCGM